MNANARRRVMGGLRSGVGDPGYNGGGGGWAGLGERRARALSLLVLLAGWAVAAPAQVRWADALRQPAEWYGTPAARELADTVLLYQDATGGWPKNTDFSQPPAPEYLARRGADRAPTIDNGGTTTPLRFVARVAAAAAEPRHRAAVLRGIDYLLVAQYANGGWPQFFPLRSGYYAHITYNDNAMVNVLHLLRDVRDAREPFGWVDAARRKGAELAVARGIECILRTQVRQDGRLTAWCAQHDEQTLAPAWARNFEPPSLSGQETVGIVRFLLTVEPPTPEIAAAVEGAVAWLRAVQVTGWRVEDFTDAAGQRDRRVVADPAAGPLWARFYDLGTNRPIFAGRDKVLHDNLNAIERERRVGYAYLGTWPASLLERDYPRWRARWGRP